MTMASFLPDPVQYQPGKGRDKETTKRMRAHVAEHLRKKRLQISVNPPKPKITPQEETARDRTFCCCIIFPKSPSNENASTKGTRKSKKQEAIADSYKICPRCLKPQFTELSRSGQLEIAKQRLPSVTPFLEVDFDPFQGLPELSSFKHSETTTRDMNEFKARGKPPTYQRLSNPNQLTCKHSNRHLRLRCTTNPCSSKGRPNTSAILGNSLLCLRNSECLERTRRDPPQYGNQIWSNTANKSPHKGRPTCESQHRINCLSFSGYYREFLYAMFPAPELTNSRYMERQSRHTRFEHMKMELCYFFPKN
jgi:hypothetical protein